MRILLLQSPRTPMQKLAAIALIALAVVLGFALLAFGLVAGLVLMGVLFAVGLLRRLHARLRGRPVPVHPSMRNRRPSGTDVIEGEYQVIERSQRGHLD